MNITQAQRNILTDLHVDTRNYIDGDHILHNFNAGTEEKVSSHTWLALRTKGLIEGKNRRWVISRQGEEAIAYENHEQVAKHWLRMLDLAGNFEDDLHDEGFSDYDIKKIMAEMRRIMKQATR